MEAFIRKARVRDVKSIHALLLQSASKGLLLARSLSELYIHVREFYVLDDGDGTVLGCCSLSIVWENLAEVRSLNIAESARRAGHGRALVESCLNEAREFGITHVFSLTYQVDFFHALGFHEVSKESLPQKIWIDCVHCPKYPDCDETAMQIILA